jgi:tetratricopeptide (TPR) repeat protein
MNQQPDIDPLTKLAIRHGTDKWGPHFYTPIYHQLFAPLRDKPVRLLEIGVGGYAFRKVGGASLAMWDDYFQWGTIIGLDVAEKQLDLGPRVKILQGSQADATFLARIAAEHGPFDVVIDDGSHVPEHVTLSFNSLFPALVDDGFYVIEDVQTAFWPQYGGSPADGGETLKLAQSILEGLNHAEVRVAASDWKPLASAKSIKAFRAFHNLFVIEKGDNTEPSTQNLGSNNAHVIGAIATMEREMAGAPTAGGIAHLALMYSLVNQNQRAMDTVQKALASWPQHLRLLTLGSRVAAAAGDKATQIKLLERACALDPTDQLLARLLRQANEAKSPVAETIID